jgi:hypothetical protein
LSVNHRRLAISVVPCVNAYALPLRQVDAVVPNHIEGHERHRQRVLRGSTPQARSAQHDVERLNVAGTSDHFTVEQRVDALTPEARSASSGNQLVKFVPCRLMSRKRPRSINAPQRKPSNFDLKVEGAGPRRPGVSRPQA